MRSSLVCPVSGKKILCGLLTLTVRPPTRKIIFSSAMASPYVTAARAPGCAAGTSAPIRPAARPAGSIARPPWPSGKNLGEVEADRLLELGVGARPRLAVRAPADELGGVPEPRPLHMVVADLDHPLGPQRHERQVLLRVPPAGRGRARGAGARLLPGPAPRVVVEGGDQRLKLGEKLLPAFHRERAHHAHAGQPAVLGEQAEQQRADRVAAALV